MVQIEGDWVGSDGTSINCKAINPNPTDGHGIFTCSVLQSITKSLALGAEIIAQKVPDSSAIEQGMNLGMKMRTSPLYNNSWPYKLLIIIAFRKRSN